MSQHYAAKSPTAAAAEQSRVERRFIRGRCQSMDDEEDDLGVLTHRREGGWRSH